MTTTAASAISQVGMPSSFSDSPTSVWALSPVPSSSGAKPPLSVWPASVPTVTWLSPDAVVLGEGSTSWSCSRVASGLVEVNRTVHSPALGNSTGPE
jgi:hypothetical protein